MIEAFSITLIGLGMIAFAGIVILIIANDKRGGKE